MSLFSITCSRCGGSIGGPLGFSPGLRVGTSCAYSPGGDPATSVPVI